MSEQITMRKIAKEYDLPMRFLKDLHNTGRLTFSGFFKHTSRANWELYLKEVGDIDKRRDLLWKRYKK